MEKWDRGGGGQRRGDLFQSIILSSNMKWVLYNRRWAAKVNFVIPERRGAATAVEPVPDRPGKSSFLRRIQTEIRPGSKSVRKIHTIKLVGDRKPERENSGLAPSVTALCHSTNRATRGGLIRALALDSVTGYEDCCVYTRPAIDSRKRPSL